MDGLGALIITPTRELAYQIFETLKKIGAKHEFSAGLIIGSQILYTLWQSVRRHVISPQLYRWKGFEV